MKSLVQFCLSDSNQPVRQALNSKIDSVYNLTVVNLSDVADTEIT